MCVLFDSRKVPCIVKNWTSRNTRIGFVAKTDVLNFTYRAGIPNLQTFLSMCTQRLCSDYLCFTEIFSFLLHIHLGEKKFSTKRQTKNQEKLHSLNQPLKDFVRDMTTVFCWERYVEIGFYKDWAVSVWKFVSPVRILAVCELSSHMLPSTDNRPLQQHCNRIL